MISDIAVSFHNISKSYILFQRPQDRLKESVFKYFGKHYGRVFWALRNVSYQLHRSEVLGIIGRNGSGKSTLLQIIAGTLQPTTGSLTVNGRIAAMLELGSGINPEFTGRENIFLNGSILGLNNKEINERLDQIINFAELGAFIDQPVKIYSSGMYIRLAFAIASSIDPDILIIDEALSVGDGGFVIKCMNRMKQLKDRGTSILLATHDVQTVRSFCDAALWLNNGTVELIGMPIDVTSQYIQYIFKEQEAQKQFYEISLSQQYEPSINQFDVDLKSRTNLVRWGSGEIEINKCMMEGAKQKNQTVFEYGERINIKLEAIVHANIQSKTVGFGMALRNHKGLDIITSTTIDQGNLISDLCSGQVLLVSFDFDNILAPGDYALVLNVEDRNFGTPRYMDFIENALVFRVVSNMHIFSFVLPKVNQTIQRINPMLGENP